MRTTRSLALTAFLLPGLLLAQEPVVLTLREALRRTAEGNVEAMAADRRVEQAMARLEPARGALGPQVSAGVSATRQTRNLEAQGFPLPPGQNAVTPPFSTYDARLKLTQTLFDPSAARRLESARRGQALAEADRTRARQDLLALTAVTYIEARRAEGTYSLAEQGVLLARTKAGLARERASAGTATALEADQADFAVAEAQAGSVSALLSRDQARRDLLSALALPDGTALLFGEDPLPAESTGTREDPDLRFAEAQRDARRADLAAARGENVPKASLAADYGFIGKDASGMKDTYTVGAQASWPLFDGGQRRGRQRELAAQTREAESRADDAGRRADLKLAQAKEAAEAARLLLTAREADLDLARRREELDRERRAAGTASELELREASFVRAQAADRRDEAASLLWTAEVGRRRALGQMEELIK